MTERSKAGHGPRALPVIVTALGSFLIVLVILGVQMRIGKDPVLKPAVAAEAPRKIVKRRVVVRRVIVTDAPADTAGPAARTSAPTPAAPAPANPTPAPTPAPAPPPPVTRSS